MRAFWVCLLLSSLTACQVTRTVAGPVSTQFRTAGHSEGFAVTTTSMWRQRMDPAASVRFRRADGTWGDWLAAFDLRVDHHGAWVTQTVPAGEIADEIRITGLSDELSDILTETRPRSGAVTKDGGAWILTAPRSALVSWVRELELAIALRVRKDKSVFECPRIDQCTELHGDPAALHYLRNVLRGEPLGTWQLSSKEQGRSPTVAGSNVVKLLRDGHETLVGYDWEDVAGMEIRNLSGGRTLAAIIGTSAAAVVVLPVALAVNSLGASSTTSSGPSSSSGSDATLRFGGLTTTNGDWSPQLAGPASLGARPLFTLGTRVRSIVRVTAAIDATAATNADFFASGLIARVRLMEMLEIGGGVRRSFTHIDGTTKRSTSGVFQFGLHVPLDAPGRVGIALGIENGSGGAIARDVRLPWGPRFQPTSGRWFVSLQPATPSYLRMNNVEKGRWSLNIGGEVGMSF